ncbi:MAG TPA: hypothetical protein VLY23_15620 [Candidatus Acidoferrum sp.]|nr:hypothetical protein [Candidatus Acidoferrum sp.]
MISAQHETPAAKREAGGWNPPVLRSACRLVLTKLAILALLVSLTGLATLAKDGQYYPTTNPARQASISTKMNVAQPTTAVESGPLQTAARIVLPPPSPMVCRRVEPQSLQAESSGLTVSLQPRSPPTAVL